MSLSVHQSHSISVHQITVSSVKSQSVVHQVTVCPSMSVHQATVCPCPSIKSLVCLSIKSICPSSLCIPVYRVYLSVHRSSICLYVRTLPSSHCMSVHEVTVSPSIKSLFGRPSNHCLSVHQVSVCLPSSHCPSVHQVTVRPSTRFFCLSITYLPGRPTSLPVCRRPSAQHVCLTVRLSMSLFVRPSSLCLSVHQVTACPSIKANFVRP